MTKDWTTLAAEHVMDFWTRALQDNGYAITDIQKQEIARYVAVIIRNTHETEGRADCEHRVAERSGERDVGVQDQARDRLLARMAGNIAAGALGMIDTLAFADAASTGCDLGDSRAKVIEDIADQSVDLAEAILERIGNEP